MKPELPPGMRAIYVLCDPDGTPRYVGKTNRPRQRLWSHLSMAKSRPWQSVGAAWIKSLLDEGRRPVMQLLEIVPEADAGIREYEWIRDLLLDGHPLTNAPWLLRHLRHWYDQPGNRNTASPMEMMQCLSWPRPS